MNHDIAQARRIMSRANFDIHKRRKALIWAAKRNPCDTCKALEFTPCINLTRKKQGFEVEVKWPHENRIDYQLLVSTLHQRGYY